MRIRPPLHLGLILVAAILLPTASAAADDVPPDLAPWLRPQTWHRDTDAPVLSLGMTEHFDDTHIFAPTVIHEHDQFRMWYCGSRGAVADRVFRLGLAISPDGRRFQRHPNSPVFAFADNQTSVLTPTFLRTPDGTVLRESGRLRIWFAATNFHDPAGLHTLRESTSTDGLLWSAPSAPLMSHVYAPTILRDNDTYRMWYTDVEQEPWIIRHATSPDGHRWTPTPEPCLTIDQSWEKNRLFYPTVLKIDGAYLIWYGSYWTARGNTTALGFAVSSDGLTWTKHPDNPVLRPRPDRPWESNYVTSQSVLGLSDGSFRIWYASRKRPPFINKYFALNTAVWKPAPAADSTNQLPPK